MNLGWTFVFSRLLKVEQPENLERIQNNAMKRKVQENLGVSGLWDLNTCQWFWMIAYR